MHKYLTLSWRPAALLPFVLLTAGVSALHQARAQNPDLYPARPIRILVTVPPGGAADFVARTVGQKLSEVLGQPVVVDNRAGASGTIAADAAAKAAPDGYTLLQNSITTHGIGPHILPKLPYDSFRDLAPVILLSRLPLIMVANADVPAASLRELVALVKAQPGKFTFASSGNGGAQVNIMFDGAPSLLPHVKAGKLRPLAAASKTRNRLLPDLPTFGELGYQGIEVSLWYGVQVPAATPRAIVDRLNAESAKILATPASKPISASLAYPRT